MKFHVTTRHVNYFTWVIEADTFGEAIIKAESMITELVLPSPKDWKRADEPEESINIHGLINKM